MTQRTKTALEIIQVALPLGVLGDIMLRQMPWGLNAFLFVTAFVFGLILLWRRHRRDLLNKTNIALASAMVFFASMFLIRASEQLLVFDTLAIIVMMGVLLLSNFDIKAPVSGVFHYMSGLIGAGSSSLLGGFLLLGADIDWKTMPGGKTSRNLFAVLRGLAIALPLLLIFGGLFMAADAVFEGWVNRAINFDLDVVVSHVVVTSLLAWLTAGYFRAVIVKGFLPEKRTTATDGGRADAETESDNGSSEAPGSFVAKVAAEQTENEVALPNNASILEHINISDPPNEREAGKRKREWQNIDNSGLPSVFTFGSIEVGLILGLLNLLFLSFVLVQLPYLFGGMELVQNTPDFKLAEYARRGFGELVVVSGLVLPLLLVSQWLIRKEEGFAGKLYKLLAGILIALLFVIMTSAAQRLLLLTGSLGYGLTTARLYPMIFMIWLAAVFVWFAVTVLRERRQYFAWGALWSALFVLAATHALNPDDFIARTNIRLYQAGREFDAKYNSDLSADAVPALLGAAPLFDRDDWCVIRARLAKRRVHAADESDLRSWNLSRMVANSELERNSGALNATGCPDDLVQPSPDEVQH
jgi:hypothetical protein